MSSLRRGRTLCLLSVLLLLGGAGLAQDGDCPETLTLACEATDGANYPIEISWTNDDPDDEYAEIEISRSGVLIATIDGSEESYTDTDGIGGQLVYEVTVLDVDGECLAVSTSCIVPIGAFTECSLDADGQEEDFGGAGSGASEFSFEVRACYLALIDGTTDEDLSPTEDERADIDDLVVDVVLTTTDVGALELTLTSPEGTSVGLWDLDGGEVEWTEQTITFSDVGELIPDTVPDTCEECLYAVAGPGTLEDFYAEDARGDWTLEASSSVESTLHDWCLGVFPDELTSHHSGSYIRGDVDGNGAVSAIIDCLRFLQWVFGDAAKPPCLAAADVNGDGEVRALVDSWYLLVHFFGDGDAPPAPFPICGWADPGYPDAPVLCPGEPEPDDAVTCLEPTICP